jgi:drug/metabolite transporter (DMT)-like permease
MQRRWMLYLLALATVTFWGASFPLTKVALQWTGPMSLAFLRWCISALILLAWLLLARKTHIMAEALRRDWVILGWASIAGVTLFYALENLALLYTTATNAGILSNLTSVFIALLGAWWLRERVPVAGWAAMLAAFVGAALVSQGSGDLAISQAGLAGDAMMVVACVFAAIYSIGGKQLGQHYPAAVVTTLVANIGALFLLPLALWEGISLAIPVEGWAALLVLGLGAGALANLWWIYILSRMAAARAGMALFLIPVISTALSVVALNEPLTPAMILGGLVVLGGVGAMERFRN